MVPIDRGAAPQLKSDEFLDLPLLLHGLGPILSLKPQEKVLHILGAGLPETAQVSEYTLPPPHRGPVTRARAYNTYYL